jgi:NRPS condensation-like uncharacterized protein
VHVCDDERSCVQIICIDHKMFGLSQNQKNTSNHQKQSKKKQTTTTKQKNKKQNKTKLTKNKTSTGCRMTYTNFL